MHSYIRCPLPEFQDEWCLPGYSSAPTPKSILESHGLDGQDLTRYNAFSINPKIQCVVVIPRFTLATSLARQVLPSNYSRADCVFNLGRLTMLIHALQQESINPLVIHESMQDKIHQTYRAHLVPGLEQILELSPKTHEGLLGVCLSGAGPTVLALCVADAPAIGQRIVDIFANHRDDQGNAIQADCMVLDFDTDGIVVTDTHQ